MAGRQLSVGFVGVTLLTSILADNGPDLTFLSEPNLKAPMLNVTINNNANALAPGYLFVAPYNVDQPAPYIYDGQGNLVWSGSSAFGQVTAFNLQAVTYQNAPHLSFFSGNVTPQGYGQGQGILTDNTYTETQRIQSGNGRVPIDLHELGIVDGATALVTIYQPVTYDLSAFGVTASPGWIVTGIFQEVTIGTGEVVFEWSSLDYIDPSASFVAPNDGSSTGDGLTEQTAWDYFHINSIDKTPEGDYVVSSRHTSCIYRISHTDKSVTWRLGGRNSSFALQNFDFSWQHDARVRDDRGDSMTISLFDNASNGMISSAPASSAKFVVLSISTMTATLQAQFNAPNSGLQTTSQGDVQVLSNGNVLIGWGDQPFVSEHTQDGTAIWLAQFSGNNTQNYRAFKFEWQAAPQAAPSLWAGQAADAGTSLYVSWNGATQVASWQFYTSGSSSGTFQRSPGVPKTGFETSYTVLGSVGYAYAVALDGNGNVLGKSSVVQPSAVPGSGPAQVLIS